jgi:subtilisin family serine protease
VLRGHSTPSGGTPRLSTENRVEVQVLSSASVRVCAFLFAAALSAALCSGDVFASGGSGATTEVVVTLKSPSLAAFGASSRTGPHAAYLTGIAAAQDALAARVTRALPQASVRWRYTRVANGFAVSLPTRDVAALTRIPGVDQVWPSVRYHALAGRGGPEQIGADKLWGPGLATAGNGMKIGIIDDGLQATHAYFNPAGYAYPAGFPKGQTQFTTPKVIVQRTFAPPSPKYADANLPFDPKESFHATHVAGIAAGNNATAANGTTISGVAPKAYLGNYKALTIPTPEFGLDGNSAEIAAAIDAAVADGMDVINLSLGEPEVEPARDIVVAAIDRAAAAGVVPVVAAGNDFGDFGFGSVSSPGSAPRAITVAAVTANNVVADFSSGGPTPVSLQMKPDVSAPGAEILSSLPGGFGRLSGTSMAAPHIAGASALLLERHPTWTVAQVKSALEQSGDAVRSSTGAEALTTREGGGVANLVRADNPLLFAAPAGLSFGRLAPGASTTAAVTLTDAGGGAGAWTAAVQPQTGAATVTVPPAATVPGSLQVTATAGATPGDSTGFVVLTRGADVRRIPYFLYVSTPRLVSEPRPLVKRPGTYTNTTKGAPSLVSEYRYPTAGDVTYAGPERAFKVSISGRPANFGAVVLAGTAVPHVVFDGLEDHLAGYTGLPLDLNPYRATYGRRVRVAGAVLPAAGAYDLVFDTRSARDAGKFTFRYWVNDVTPPRLSAAIVKRTIVVRATDAGAGVDPSSVVALLDGKQVHATWRAGAFRVPTAAGRHTLVIEVGDYQETKNMEDVAKILPNTATLRVNARVR